MKSFLSLMSILLLLSACSSTDDGKADVGSTPDTADSGGIDNTNEPDNVEADTTPEDNFDATKVVAITEPTAFRGGTGTTLLFAPIGIPKAGYAPPPGEGGPLTLDFPATKDLYVAPKARTVVLEGGLGRLIMCRVDMIAVSSVMREAVLKRLKEIYALDFSNDLILSATHTHSGPGRFNNGALSTLTDGFHNEYFYKLVDSIVDSIVLAFEDREKITFAYTVAQDTSMQADRRCENPVLELGDLPVLRFSRLDGSVKFVIVNYAVHGTVINATTAYLSADVGGVIEKKVEELFPVPVPVIFFLSWAGDMLPEVKPEMPDPDFGYSIEGAIAWIERLATIMKEDVKTALDQVQLQNETDVEVMTSWLPIDIEAIGYAPGEFDHPTGALCGVSLSHGNCWEEGVSPTPIENMNQACIDLPAEPPVPDRTPITVARIGSFAIATFPSEVVTALGSGTRDDVVEALGADAGMLISCAQDHLFYSVPEQDWWQGGYEASFNVWGPRQGDYLRESQKALAEHLADPTKALPWTEATPLSLPAPASEPRIPGYAKEPGVVTLQPQKEVGPNDTVTFRFTGGDPWSGNPQVVLQRLEGDSFVEALRPNGTSIDVSTYEMTMHMVLEPTFKDKPSVSLRKYHFEVRVPLTRQVPMDYALPDGTYRFAVTGPYSTSAGKVKTYSLTSDQFEILTDK